MSVRNAPLNTSDPACMTIWSFAKSDQPQLSHDMLIGLLPSSDLLNRPGERRAQGFLGHRSAGFADGHQPVERPLLRTALLQLADEQTVRQHDQVHMPGLALDITQLTVAQSELLLAVPMKGLRPCPAMAVPPHDPTHLPGDPMRHQNLDRLRVVAISPEDHNPNLVLYVGDAHRHGEVPLPLVPDPQLLP